MIFDDTNPDVVETVESTEPEQATEKVQQPVAELKTAPQTEDSVAKNMRALREAKDRAERERDEERRLRLLEAESRKAAIPDEEEIRLGDDDIAEGKHLKALKKQIKRLEEDNAKQRQQSAMMTTEVRLKTQYPDFDKVVSNENIKSLSDQYPEIAQTLNTGQDLYATGVSAYTMIKKLGIHVEDEFVQEKAVAQKNIAKPRPMASLSPQQGDSPLSHANAFANGLTDELRAQSWKEMNEYRKNF